MNLALALAERYEGEGKFLAAVERCRWARSIAPTDERVTRRLLRLLDGQGDRATALREFEAFAKMLDEDYGLEPSPETVALVQRIRSRETPVLPDTGPSPGISDRLEREESSSGGGKGGDATTVVDETSASRLAAVLSDRYRVERKIDSGGMSVVYLAEDLKHGREVAIKVLRPELAESIAVERFLQEIHFGASLQHPNIVSLHDSGKADGSPYYVMPYFAGGSLRDHLKREKQLPLEDAIQIALEVANALQAAHGKGVLHRDVKPANIMLEAGHAVVSDFGIARALT
ncbi:MAG: protein kinase, partial [Gemmatimonadales bacterium]